MLRKKKLIVLGAAVVAAASIPVVVTVTAEAESSVNWAPCADLPMDCATLSVPMDYDKPDGEKISVAITRLAAKDKSRRRGVLLLNPGGPGGAGSFMPGVYQSQPIADVYDLIGFDPRGVGQSTPLNCEFTEEIANLPQPAVATRPTDAEFPLIAHEQQAKEEACAKSGGEYRRHVTTRNTARDMDSIRAALGEDKINYLGVSYGTWLGAVYGEMFPDRMDRNVLDSSMHPTNDIPQQNRGTVKAIKSNFDAWASWVADRDKTFQLGGSPSAVRGSIDRIAAAIAKKPVSGFETLADFDNAVGESTRYRLMWAPFAKNMQKTLAETAGHRPDPVLAASNQRAAGATAKMADTTINGAYQVITCEWAWPKDMAPYYRDMRQARDTFPYGDTVGRLTPTTCAFQKTPHEPQIEIGPRRYPQGLVLAADHDPQTVYPSGQAMALALDNPLITVRDNGAHGQYAVGLEDQNGPIKTNECVNDKVNAYLVEGRLPQGDADCDTANPPAAIPADPRGIDIEHLIPDLGDIAQDILDSIIPSHRP